MRSLTHHQITIAHSGDEFIINQCIGDTADDVITVRISEDQAIQISKFMLAAKAKPDSDQPEPLELADGFFEFWAEYPRKDGKARAFELWKRHHLHAQRETVMKHLCAVKQTDQWAKDGGKFVPHAATYLSQKRYLDEVEQEDITAWK